MPLPAPLRLRVLSLYRRALRISYRLPAASFPDKTRYNIREVMEIGPARPTIKVLTKLVEDGEYDVNVLDELTQQPPEVFAQFMRKAMDKREVTEQKSSSRAV